MSYELSAKKLGEDILIKERGQISDLSLELTLTKLFEEGVRKNN